MANRDQRPSRRGRQEWAAVVLLPLTWVPGLVLLWRSRAWTTTDKLIGTLVPPGGWLPLVAIVAWLFVTVDCPPSAVCSVGITPGAFAILVALAVLPLASAVYLAVRADRTR